MNIEILTEQALKLAPAERAQIAEILLESLGLRRGFCGFRSMAAGNSKTLSGN
ncbi:MAG: hypothetical protein ACXWT3_04275 [Methylococcaceae bacterium]